MATTRQFKLESKTGKDSMYVQIHGNKIFTDKMGFTPVKLHVMRMDSLARHLVKQYYVIPDGITI